MKNKIGYIIGSVIIVLLLVLIVSVNSSKEEKITSLKCEGEYIKYNGNCCFDTNYNNVCDSLEKKEIENNGKVLNVPCSIMRPCNNARYDYLGNGELCNMACQNSQCVLIDCEILECNSNSDCRDNAYCSYGKCIKSSY